MTTLTTTMDHMVLLREQIARIERRHRHTSGVPRLSTGIDAIDSHLDGGLCRGAVHEITGWGQDRAIGTRPAWFVASVLSRHPGHVVWLSASRLDLHGAGLRAVGLDPGRLICVEAENAHLLGLCEDILRERGVLALVAELETPPDLTASRRLQLAAEAGGVTGFLIHRQKGAGRSSGHAPASACQTRWRIGSRSSVLPFHPSFQSPVLGPARHHIELLRQRGGLPGAWSYEIADHASYPVPLVPPLADGTLVSEPSRYRPTVGAGAARS